MIKNILITGAAGNLGKAVTAKFSAEGYRVIGTVQHGHPIPDNGAEYHSVDLADPADAKELFDTLKGTYKTIQAGIFLVGGFAMGTIEDTDGKAMMDMLRLNFMTAYNCAHYTYGWMRQSYGGTMIFIGAKPAAEGGISQVLSYGISKKAVIELANSINEGKEKDIRAHVMVPSIIDTPENRKSMPNADFSDWVKAETIADKMYNLITSGGELINKIYNKA